MSVTITLEADIKPGERETLLSLLKRLLPETKVYKGFISISIHIEKNSSHLLFFEKWESIPDYEAYLSWRQDTGVMNQLGALFSEPPTIRYYNTENVSA